MMMTSLTIIMIVVVFKVMISIMMITIKRVFFPNLLLFHQSTNCCNNPFN